MGNIYARIKAVKINITELGETVNEELIIEAAEQAGAELESSFLYLIADNTPFDLQTIEMNNPTVSNRSDLSWFTQLNNELTELLFIQKTNGNRENQDALKAFRETKIPEIIEKRFKSIPAHTE